MPSRGALVIDAGSSRPRCAVFDETGRAVASREGRWAYSIDPEGSTLSREFDTPAVWKELCDLTGGCVADANQESCTVGAVAVTGQRQAVAFLDADGSEVYLGPNIDLRAVFEGAAIDEEARDEVYATTGHIPSLLFAAAKLKWFQVHHPEAYARIAHAVTLADWIAWRLTGVLCSEVTLAGEAGLLDIARRTWCSDLLDRLGVMSASVPLVHAGSIIGEIGSRASQDSGIPTGTPVAAAGADTQCGLLGMGVSRENDLGVVAGWSAPLQLITSRPVLSSDAMAWAGCFLEGDRWVIESSPGDVGNSYRWLADTLFDGAEDAYGAMDTLAGAMSPGADGTWAFLGPARMDMAAVGMRSGGFVFPVPLTHGDVGRAHLVRASLESAAFAIKANVEQIEDIADVQPHGVTVGGGMTRTATWAQVLADVLGREIAVSHEANVSAAGASLCGRTALGDYSSLSEAADARCGTVRALEPDPVASSDYQELYEQWTERFQALREFAV